MGAAVLVLATKLLRINHRSVSVSVNFLANFASEKKVR